MAIRACNIVREDINLKEIFNSLTKDFKPTGDLKKDAYEFLIKHNRNRIANHSIRVADMSKALAKRFGVNENLAEIAGLLHDIGGVYKNDQRVDVARQLGLEVLAEEEEYPMILHQKISKVMAEEIFNINDFEVLNAICCHTTLSANSTLMDMILFVADKLEWDQDGFPPYLNVVEEALNESIELAAFRYIEFLFQSKESLKVVHPWLAEAYLGLGRYMKKVNFNGE